MTLEYFRKVTTGAVLGALALLGPMDATYEGRDHQYASEPAEPNLVTCPKAEPLNLQAPSGRELFRFEIGDVIQENNCE